MALGREQRWTYRGQVIPEDESVTVEAELKAIDEDERLLTFDGWLSVDGRIIYQMTDFTLQWVPGPR